MKAIIDEQEAQSSSPATAQEWRIPAAAGVVHVQSTMKPRTTDAKSSTDLYESCLDLAAEFLGRG